MYNPGYKAASSLDDAPLEVYLEKELSNPHSRAKKQKRWQFRRANEKHVFNERVAEEVKISSGRPEREIRAEVAHRLRQELKEHQHEEKKMRWKNRIGDITAMRKARKKVKKEERHRRKLTQLVLEDDDPNQVIPKSL